MCDFVFLPHFYPSFFFSSPDSFCTYTFCVVYLKLISKHWDYLCCMLIWSISFCFFYQLCFEQEMYVFLVFCACSVLLCSIFHLVLYFILSSSISLLLFIVFKWYSPKCTKQNQNGIIRIFIVFNQEKKNYC